MARSKLPPPVRFRLDGSPTSALPGDTLLQAMSRQERAPLLTRSVRYHRPRGALCGLGQCTGCLVRVNGVPNVRACRYVPTEGDVVSRENAWPSVRWDLFALLDTLFPGHVDTLHGFRRPGFLRPLYHSVIRRLAGYGRLPDRVPAPPHLRESPPDLAEIFDLLLVGAGPVGQGVMDALSRGDVPPRKVIWVGRRRPGDPPVPEGKGAREGEVIHLPPPGADGTFSALVTWASGGTSILRARGVILAVGGYDGSLVFGQNDRPGIMTGDGALASVAPEGTPPFRRALLFGGGERSRELLERWGSRVHAVAAPGKISPALTRAASDLGVSLWPFQLLVAARGRRRVRRAILRDRTRDVGTHLDVDAIILSHRRLPNVPLLFQAGAKMRWDSRGSFYLPEVGPDQTTSVPGLFVVGRVAGEVSPIRIQEGIQRMVRAIPGTEDVPVWDEDLPTSSGEVPVPDEGEDEEVDWRQYYLESLALPLLGKRMVCPCEDVVMEELDEAVHEGFSGMEVVKRVTGTGTGLCQGRYCLPEALLLLSLFEGRPPAELGFITQRPPVWPTPLGDLAQIPPAPSGPPGGG